ncbi:MAG: FG-GAP-like repeat-containing protein [bacterium]
MNSHARRRVEPHLAALRSFVFVPLLLIASTSVQKDSTVRPLTPRVLAMPAATALARQPDITPGARTAGAGAGWWQTVSAQIEGGEYRASVTSAGLQAPNRAQGLRTYFRAGGIEVVPRQQPSPLASSWRFAWRTTQLGRAGQMHVIDAAPLEPKVDGARVCYVREGFDEWYENKKEGLEQGFTVRERPAGEGALRLEGHVAGALHAQLKDGAVDFLDEHGARVLRYADVHAVDASGRALPARLGLSGEQLAILIEDGAATYPIAIDPLMTSPAWTADGDQASEFFGISVGTAGDVNGDGYSDVIVGAHRYDTGQTDAGRAFVYLGSASGLVASPAWTAEGDQASAYFGRSVGAAGDVNGDGYSDVIVGAYGYDNGQTDEGRAYVYLGSASGLAASPSWTAESNQDSAYFGISVGTAGDVNGDGYADVIVGARGYDNGQTDEGRAYVYLGSASGLAASAAWTAESDMAGATFGASVGTAGDVNGDGYSDVIVGAPLYDLGLTRHGQAYVYLGSASGLAGSPAWTAQAQFVASDFAVSVGTAGDVNGDGYSDVIVGDDTVGQAYLYLGSASGLAGSASWTADAGQSGSGLGRSVGTAGDVNGDGFADVVIGAYGYDDGLIEQGRAYVYLGSSSGLAVSPTWTAEGDQAIGFFGSSAGTAGDVNGDGYSDVIVGAPLYDGAQSDAGRVYVYHGSASGLAASPGWTVASDQPDSYFGVSVGTAGDVNGDGYSDVIVGAMYYDDGEANEGRAYLYLGSSSGLSASPAWTAESDQAGAGFGVSAGTAGDVNGDGYSDIIVGAYSYDDGQVDEGRAYVYLGSSSGLSASPAWTAESDREHAWFGGPVGTAGDVNGDGYADVVVGAKGDLLFGVTGRAHVYLGSSSGLAASPAWTAQDDQYDSAFGASAATAGDVNGDGYSDVIVGAPGYGPHQEGKAYVYLGSPTGLAASPAWTAMGDQPNANLGSSVGTAGDVNGGGYSDIIVGAPGRNNFAGRACVYMGSVSGPSTNPQWTVDGPTNASFGTAVGTAGDVNGDGYSDVIVGTRSARSAYLYLGPGLGASPAWTDGTQGGEAVGVAGDVNGDGYSDVIVGNTGYYGGAPATAAVYYGNGGDGLDLAPRQVRTDDSAPIALLGQSDSEVAFRAKVLGRTPAGRGRVRLVVEKKRLGTSFNGNNLQIGPRTDTGAPGPSGSAVSLTQLVSGLTPGDMYHWRARVITDSPFFPRSRWVWGWPGNGGSEADLRGHLDNPSVYSAYTGTGTNVQVTLGPAVTATFDQVTSEGITSVNVESAGPPPPAGFQIVPVSPPVYDDISTTATFTGQVTVCLHYNDTDVVGSEANLKMYHFASGSWVDVTSSLDTNANIVCGQSTSLSPFVIVEPQAGVGAPEVGALAFGLKAPSPSPFRGSTVIEFALPRAGEASVRIFDVAGRLVRELAHGAHDPGSYRMSWDGRDTEGKSVASGVYFVRLQAAGQQQTRRVVRLK